jgi:hypothetical protein
MSIPNSPWRCSIGSIRLLPSRKSQAGRRFRSSYIAPAQTDEPLGQARCFPDGTRVRFESDVTELKTSEQVGDTEFGYPVT